MGSSNRFDHYTEPDSEETRLKDEKHPTTENNSGISNAKQKEIDSNVKPSNSNKQNFITSSRSGESFIGSDDEYVLPADLREEDLVSYKLIDTFPKAELQIPDDDADVDKDQL
mmetsp:Transcript_26730/g.70198  ORF Transcript_26730/g.70198 Transcript_26730/m.70198 type:complete len:113 (+) Transcript_26730:67-405(+)